MRWNGSRGCPTFRLVLLPPAVEGVEVEHDVAVEVRIGEAQASPGAHLRPEVDVHDLPLGGVHRKRDRRVENGPPRHVGQQVADVVGPTGGRLPRHQRRGHVLGRHGQEATTRRGSHSSTARVGSIAVRSPRIARIRFAGGS
jgi:hypothetical protein